MGQNNSSNVCCLKEKKESILEISMLESFHSSYCRKDSYESPIPDEVYTINHCSSYHSENFIDEWSTDIDKQHEISEGSLKKLPENLKVYLGAGKHLRVSRYLNN